MFAKRSILMALSGLLVLATGCGDDIDDARSVIEVKSVADAGVFVCGIWDAGSDKEFPSDDDFIPAGHIPVLLQNRGYNEQITNTPFTPYGDFVVTGVAVQWVPTDVSSPQEALDALNRYAVNAQYDRIIPAGGEASFNVMLVPFRAKSDPYLANLAAGRGGDGSTRAFTAGARITFTGHDSGDEREVSFDAYAVVEFIGVVVDE